METLWYLTSEYRAGKLAGAIMPLSGVPTFAATGRELPAGSGQHRSSQLKFSSWTSSLELWRDSFVDPVSEDRARPSPTRRLRYLFDD